VRIGIDIGGMSFKGGIVSEDGEILLVQLASTKGLNDYAEMEARLFALVDILMGAAKLQGWSIDAIGVGVPGLADVDSDYVVYCTNLGWINVPLGKHLKEKYGLPTFLDNDATVAGIAESAKGCTKGAANSVFITLGTGVGGGIIINGKVTSGEHNKGSEIGHMIVGENFYDCNCGNNGCLETFASATALMKDFQRRVEAGEATSLYHDAAGAESVTAKDIVDGAREDDPAAKAAVERLAKYLGIGLANVVNLLDPEVIALGGGLSKAGEFLLEQVDSEMRKRLVFKAGAQTRLEIAQLSNDAGMIGAAMLVDYK
jgi:glucokinase